jgi:hypothetical protein
LDSTGKLKHCSIYIKLPWDWNVLEMEDFVSILPNILSTGAQISQLSIKKLTGQWVLSLSTFT